MAFLPTVVQVAKANVKSLIVGGDLGPGTRGMVKFRVDFTNPVTAGNDILIAVAAYLTDVNPDIVALGPRIAFEFGIPGGALPDRTYYVAVSYTDSTGRETPIGDPVSVFIPAGNLVRLSQPNPNINVIPNAVSWNAYAGLSPTTLTLQEAGISPSDFWQEPTTGLISGSLPAGKNIIDLLGNPYTTLGWTNAGSGANQFGVNGTGFFYSSDINGGANQLELVFGVFNPNPFIDQNVYVSAIAAELQPVSVTTGNLSTQAYTNFKQGSDPLEPVSVDLVDTSGTTRTTDFGNLVESSVAVIDMTYAPLRDIFACIFTGTVPGTYPYSGSGLTNPTLTGGSYAEVGDITSADDIMWMWFWLQDTAIDLTCPSSTASIGVPYSSAFTPSGDTPPDTFSIVSGALPTGLTLDTSTGAVTGTPTASGTFDYTGEVVDSTGATARAACSIVVGGGSFACGSLPGGTLGVAYTGTMALSGATAPVEVSITAGSLPPGLYFSITDTTISILGVPTALGTYSFTAMFTDALGNFGSVTCSITIGGSTVTTDNQFELRKIIVTMRPAKRLPTRGSTT